MKRILFYATPSDISGLLEKFEVAFPVKYIVFGADPTGEFSPFSSHREIEGLGTADHDQTSACKSYLVYSSNENVVATSFIKEDGTKLYSMTQMNNENSVVFRPAGVWTNDVCIYGEVSTIHDSESSKKVMKAFYKQISKNFVKVKSFWLGSEAKEMLISGKRLTMAVQSPPEYNLTIT